MKCVVLDDEPYAHQVLEHYINETPGITLVAKFRNAIEAFEYLGKNKVELLFLDIEMPLINGLTFLKALQNPPHVIFTTGSKEYAYEGFELNAVDYLLKPFSYERFLKALTKLELFAKDQTGSGLDTLLIKVKEGMVNVRQQDILFIEGCKDYVKVVTAETSYTVYKTLKSMLGNLNRTFFIQAHRSYLVNKNHVDRIADKNLYLSDENVIPIGKLYKKALLADL
ncbi:MAG: response regulator transcription factor [Pedobacter sp.]|nr:MAG: response regulator transcription factor [Pedobacter sp.]